MPAHAGGKVAPRGGCLYAHVFAQRAEDLRIVIGLTKEGAEDAVVHRERRVLDERLGIHDLAETKAIALRAGAVGCVEREIARLQIVDGVAVLGTGERQRVLAAGRPGALGRIAVRQRATPTLPCASLVACSTASAMRPERVLADDDAVHHHLDGVLELLIEFDLLVELRTSPSMRTREKPSCRRSSSSLCVLALAAHHHGSQHQRATALAVLARILSATWSVVWRSISRPHSGQCGVPMRA